MTITPKTYSYDLTHDLWLDPKTGEPLNPQPTPEELKK